MQKDITGPDGGGGVRGVGVRRVTGWVNKNMAITLLKGLKEQSQGVVGGTRFFDFRFFLYTNKISPGS